MKRQRYPLHQLTTIKQKRVEEAEKKLRKAKEDLSKAEAALKTAEEQRDGVKTTYQEKLAQLRHKLDIGEAAPKIVPMREHLKTVAEQLEDEENKVNQQKKVVQSAEKDVETARQELFRRQKEQEKIQLHKQEWQQQARRDEQRQEYIQHDEIGSAMHEIRKRNHE